MSDSTKILEALRHITQISNDGNLNINQKGQKILDLIFAFMHCESGSIIILKNRRRMEVIASDNKDLRGAILPLKENTPSSWVIKNKKVLNVKDIRQTRTFIKRFDHYETDAFLVAPVINNGKVIGIINLTDRIGKGFFTEEEQGVLLDIAAQIIGTIEIQRLLEQLKSKRKALQKKNKELRRMERLKEDLYNMLVHDLKGPIAEMISNLDIMSYVTKKDNLEYLESAKTGCNNLNDMVSNLLDITRIEDGRMNLVHEKIIPEELVKESATRVFGLLKIKNLELSENYPDNQKSDFFWGDRNILIRVFQNLLTNAINHSPTGEIIELGYEYKKSSEVNFYIKDKGPGVPEEYREAIFEKFYNLGEGNGSRTYSTGLGLTFCKMALEAHGGDIWVEDSSPQGSCFNFLLPVNGAHD